MTLLGHYFRPDDPVESTAAIGRDWANVLEALPQEYIERACVAYLRAKPRKKPTPGDIYQRARALIPPQRVAPKGKPVQERAATSTAARANEILASAGPKPKQFGGSDK